MAGAVSLLDFFGFALAARADIICTAGSVLLSLLLQERGTLCQANFLSVFVSSSQLARPHFEISGSVPWNAVPPG